LDERQRRASAGPAPEQLIRLHRHSLINVLVLYGSPAEREQIARVFHRESPVRSGPFVRVDCAREEETLKSALRAWVTGESREPGDDPLLGAGRGTLFLDSVTRLTLETQRLLLEFCTRILGDVEARGSDAWDGRLVVGSQDDPGEAVTNQRFLLELYDCVNKVRIELDRESLPG
jgi:DNA-binding NtrC family response regulator